MLPGWHNLSLEGKVVGDFTFYFTLRRDIDEILTVTISCIDRQYFLWADYIVPFTQHALKQIHIKTFQIWEKQNLDKWKCISFYRVEFIKIKRALSENSINFTIKLRVCNRDDRQNVVVARTGFNFLEWVILSTVHVKLSPGEYINL